MRQISFPILRMRSLIRTGRGRRRFRHGFLEGRGTGQEARAPVAMIAKLCQDGLAVMGARRLDVFQGDSLPAMLRDYGTTDEAVAIKYPDLGEASGIVSNGDWLADVWSQGWRQIAQPLEADAVAANYSGLGHHNQQQVQILQRLRPTRQPAVAGPGRVRRDACLAVRSSVVGLGEIAANTYTSPELLTKIERLAPGLFDFGLHLLED